MEAFRVVDVDGNIRSVAFDDRFFEFAVVASMRKDTLDGILNGVMPDAAR